MTHDPLDTYQFVVRIWLESRELPGAAPLWRGSARNLATGQVYYFSTAAELAQHLARTTGGLHPDE